MTRVALLVGSLLVALAIGETAARILDPEWRLFYPPICFRPDLFEETAWGYRLHPSRSLRLHPERAGVAEETVVSNGKGFRGREASAADPGRRIVVLGDSMVFGAGVPEAERFTERLEAMQPDWRVENLGMIGYGPDLMLRALEAVGFDAAPALVVMVVYADDPRRVAPLYAGVGFPIPRYVLVGDRLETTAYPEPRPWELLRLMQGVAYARWRYTAAARPLMQAILSRWQAVVSGHAARGALVFAPRPYDGFDDRRWRRWLADWSAQAGVPYLDLTERLEGRLDVYLPRDTHWSAVGHDVVAVAMQPLLSRALVDNASSIRYGPGS